MKSKIVLVLLSLMSAGVQAGVIKGKIKDAQTGEEIIGGYPAPARPGHCHSVYFPLPQ